MLRNLETISHLCNSLQTMSRVFRALGVATATLDLGVAGKVALW